MEWHRLSLRAHVAVRMSDGRYKALRPVVERWLQSRGGMGYAGDPVEIWSKRILQALDDYEEEQRQEILNPAPGQAEYRDAGTP